VNLGITTAIALIACHGASADHFSVFAQKLLDEGYQVQIYASEHAVKKFQDRNIPITMVFERDEVQKIAEACQCSVVLTDVGSPTDIALQKAFAGRAMAYYDNPEPVVPGGYSDVANEVMQLAEKVLFANANLANNPLMDVPLEKRVGIGYYPVAQAEKIAGRRAAEGGTMRKRWFEQQGIEDRGQKLLVYFGGNNEEYFTKAFPAFLEFLEQDLPGYIFILQQHPAAKGKQQYSPKLVLSDWTTDDISVIADGALYYQTSMGPQLALTGIPIVQVGHQTYEDVMVRSGICPSVTKREEFTETLQNLKLSDDKESIYLSIGIREDWLERLKSEINLRRHPHIRPNLCALNSHQIDRE
jgi:hypothetical protein